MKMLAVGEFKSRFSEVLDEVRHGEEFVVCYGRKKEKVAVVIPYGKHRKPPVKLGVLEGKLRYCFKDGFKMTEEEFLDS